MTDRVNALLVVLDKDIRSDDVEPLVNAIRQLRNVADVELNIADAESYIAKSQAITELGRRVLDVIYPQNVTQ